MNALHDLTNDELACIGVSVSSPRALMHLLERREEVARVRQSLRDGSTTIVDIRDFVGALLAELQRGVRFPHDVAIAAVAVALQDHPGSFAEEYLRDLARTRIAELRASPMVAAACLERRRVTPATDKTVRLGPIPQPSFALDPAPQRPPRTLTSTTQHRVRAA